ncbi:hypothetical protein AB0D49_03820 [Streptomyces sp. NPDC048290]|uniref:hypothetical protein n=1 Tax=Streptomyces sp. NPDC048290 TaxID=3155811 RepID=UPI00341F34B3
MTETDTSGGRTADGAAGGLRLWPLYPTGRHRRPRPRGLVPTVAGLVLAVGALSLVPPEGGTGPGAPRTVQAGPGTAAPDAPHAWPGPDPSVTRSARATRATAASPETAPPTGGKVTESGPASPRAADPGGTPGTAPAPGTPQPSTPPAPRPSPTATPPRTPPAPPPPSTTPPAEEDDDPGLCVPLLNLCLGGLLG